MQTSIVARLFLTCLLCICATALAQPNKEQRCLIPGQWVTPSISGVQQAEASDVIARARDAQFVLLGEAHDNADHHLWQLQALGMLLGVRTELVIGMEMFPRRVQPVLDSWIEGKLSEAELLQQSDWTRVWRFDPDLYLPILRFARLNNIPVVALNVERSLISDIGASGWNAIPPGRREGVTDPAPATEDYREILRTSFREHSKSGDSEFEYFVQAQLVWDRAFAQALAEAAAMHPSALVVGIIGSGHLRYGQGVPHQLRAIGKQRTKVWLPLDKSANCDQLVGVADAAFVVRGSLTEVRPRLGVYLLDESDGISVREVVPGSVAENAGVLPGDRVIAAAGVNIRTSDDLIAIVRRQSPGTWLPMMITRSGTRLELVAKFPAAISDANADRPQHDTDRAFDKED